MLKRYYKLHLTSDSFLRWSFPKRISSVQLLSHVWLFATAWTAAHQASLSITNSCSLLKLMSIESVMPSSHLILCRPLLLLPSVFPSFRVFSIESVLFIRWPKYWSFDFSISPSSEYSGLIQVQCYKDQYCIGIWKVRSMNQGKLEVVKQEMARVNINILGMSELKWTWMAKFNSEDHYIYYCGQESLRRNGVAIIVNRRVWNAVLGCNLKNGRMIAFRFQGKPFNITVIQACAPTSNAEETEIGQFYEDLQDLLELTPKKDVLFIIGDCRTKAGSQEIPGVTAKFGRGVQNEAGQRLIEFFKRMY